MEFLNQHFERLNIKWEIIGDIAVQPPNDHTTKKIKKFSSFLKAYESFMKTRCEEKTVSYDLLDEMLKKLETKKLNLNKIKVSVVDMDEKTTETFEALLKKKHIPFTISSREAGVVKKEFAELEQNLAQLTEYLKKNNHTKLLENMKIPTEYHETKYFYTLTVLLSKGEEEHKTFVDSIPFYKTMPEEYKQYMV